VTAISETKILIADMDDETHLLLQSKLFRKRQDAIIITETKIIAKGLR
jgi:hypothetical protein